MFTEAFMRRALAAALLLGPLCGLLGVFVTARRMSFFGDTISHAALAGIAIGFWFGFVDPTLPLIVMSLVVAAAILWLKERTELLTDTIMALLLSGSVAFGIIVIRKVKNYRGELERYLFGDILSVGTQEVVLAAIATAVVGLLVFRHLNQLALLTAHEELAHVSGVPVRLVNYGFVLLLAMTVALTIRLLGIILVTSLLVIPASAARNLSVTLRQQIILSVFAGLLAGFGGVALSFQFDSPTGPTITLVCVALFVASLIAGHWRRGVRVEQSGVNV
jgi:ABC-type Mn2+/Zn2+ transport system permease subunit